MYIYVIPSADGFQDKTQSFVWPPRNRAPGQDYGVEQDFFTWLLQSPHSVGYYQADWAYCSIFWNRWYLGHNDEDGHWGGTQAARAALQAEIDRQYCGKPWFTIAEADLAALQPYLDLHGMIVFCASRRQRVWGIDIPLLAAPHPVPATPPDKRHLACFLGHMQTDGLRIRMGEALQGWPDCRIEHANHGPDEFAVAVLSSYIALAPRGQGAQSFRFYEAMQLGTVPLYLTDIDCRPFPMYIPWDECSFLHDNPATLPGFLDALSQDKERLLAMGQRAAQVYREDLAYGQWCRYVIRYLEEFCG